MKKTTGAAWRRAVMLPLCVMLLFFSAETVRAAQTAEAELQLRLEELERAQRRSMIVCGAGGAVLLLGAAALLRDERRRRTLESALREREDQFRAVVDLTPGGICTIGVERDGEVQLRYASGGFYRLMGFLGPDEKQIPLSQTHVAARVKKEDSAVFEQMLESLRQGMDEVRATFRARRRDGSYIWVTFQAIRRLEENGRRVYYAMLSDVDSLKRFQETMQENERTLQAAMRHANVDYWLYDPVRHTARQSRHSQQLFGIPEVMEDYPNSWIARGITVKEDREKLLRAYREIDEGAEYAACEVRENRPDGTVHWVEIHMTSLYDASEKRTRVLCTGADCTRRHQELERYTRQDQQRRKYLEDSVASAKLNLTKNTCAPGPSLYPSLLAGMDGTADALFERMKSRAITPEQARNFGQQINRATLMAAYERGVSMVPMDRCCWINGKKRWVSLRIEMTRNPASGDLEANVYSFDIDERKSLEQIMDTVIQREYQMLLRIDLASDTARVFSAQDGEELAQEISGAEEFLLDSVRNIFAGDDLEETLDRLRFTQVCAWLEHGEEYVIYADCRGSGGTSRHLRYAFAWLDRETGVICCAVTDVTDTFDRERRRSEELRRALEDARRANQAKSEFLSRMSHEIRTPMNAILGLTQLVRDDPRGPEVETLLEKLLTSGEYLLGLINDVLDMSRIESGRMTLNPENADLQKLHAAVYDMMEPRMRERGIRFRMDTSLATQRYAVLDRLRVQQIFINILGNAVKFSAAGTEISCVVRHELLPDGRMMGELVFRDQGCGMSREFLARAFEPFEQEGNAYQDPQCGTGLGLAIVKNLTEQMGGTVRVESELGKGSVFTVRLPAELGRAPQTEAEPEKKKAELTGRRVLLAEDHPVNTEIACKMLRRHGLEVDHAENGRAAVELYLRAEPGHYDAVLMDIRMPEMNGLEAARAIRSAQRADAARIPIIAMTANAFESDRRESREAGMNAHLSKPIRQAELIDTLRSLIR